MRAIVTPGFPTLNPSCLVSKPELDPREAHSWRAQTGCCVRTYEAAEDVAGKIGECCEERPVVLWAVAVDEGVGNLGLPIRRAWKLKWYFPLVDEAQRLCGVVLESLDHEEDARGLARHSYQSRTLFYTLFRAMIEETPIAMRRRLLLERAAWQLSRTQLSVTDISFNANYGSLEAFTRAFRKAFRVSPSLYRRMGATYTHLYAANGIHHHSGKEDTKGAGEFMDLFDIFAGQESWHTQRLLDLAKTLNDEQLDLPLKNEVQIFPWDGPDRTLRQILDRMVQTKEVWAAALTGGSMPPIDNAPPADRTPSAMLARLDRADEKFHGVLTEVRDRSGWDDTFIDALCEPPETFTFGGMFAHVVMFNAYRRMLAMDALRRLGVKVEGFGCPSEYVASLATA